MNPRHVFPVLTIALFLVGVAAVADQPPPVERPRDALPPGAVARLGSLRFQHGATIYCLVFTPDGTTIVAGGDGRVFRAFDVKTGEEVQRWAGHTGNIRSLAIAPDGKRVASSAEDGTIRLWDFKNGKELAKGEAGAGRAEALAFSPDGSVLASVTTSIRLWDVKTGALVHEFGEGRQWHMGLAYQDDKTLITADHNVGIVRYWNLPEGTERFKLAPPVEEEHVRSLVLSGDRKLLATVVNGEKGYLRLATATTGEEVRRVAGNGDQNPCCAISPDGALVAWMPRDNNEISLVDTATGKEIKRLVGATGWTLLLTFSPDGKTIAANSGGSLHLWDVKSGREHPQTRGRQGSVVGLAFTPDDKSLAVQACGPDIVLWDVAAAKEQSRLPAIVEQCSPISLQFLAAGQTLAVLRRTGQLSLWDVGKGKGKHFPVFEREHGWDILAPGARVAANNVREKATTLWNPATGKAVRELDTTDPAVAFSPSGDALLTIGEGGEVALWDVATGTKRWQVPRSVARAHSAAFSPDGSLIAWTASANEPKPVIHVVAAADGRAVRRIEVVAGAGGNLIFSRDGRTLVGEGEFIRLWEVTSGDARGQLGGDQGHLHSLTYSHDGRRLASGGGDGTVLLWDVTGAHLRDKNRTTEALWEDLAGKDAAKAYRAVWQLADSPKEAVELLRARLEPVKAPDPKRIDQLIAALDANGFEERTQAKAELAGLAEFVEPALRAAAKTPASAEVGKQLADLLEKFAERRLKPTPEQLRPVRAVEVLEEVGTAAARDVLRTLAKGAPGATLTREARASLQRLERRSNNSASK